MSSGVAALCHSERKRERESAWVLDWGSLCLSVPHSICHISVKWTMKFAGPLLRREGESDIGPDPKENRGERREKEREWGPHMLRLLHRFQLNTFCPGNRRTSLNTQFMGHVHIKSQNALLSLIHMHLREDHTKREWISTENRRTYWKCGWLHIPLDLLTFE